MIEFKIISSPDKSQQATYQHLGKELTLGKQEGDMIIDDPAFGASQLKIVVQDDKSASIENLNSGVEVRLNGKPITGVAALKEKDNVTVARTTLNFSRLDLSPLPPPERYEHPLARERFTAGSKEQIVLDTLEVLEKASAGAPAAAGAAPPPPPGAKAPPPLPSGAKPPPLPPRKNN